jgi:predicted Zn-dependent peptidase
MPIGSMEDLSAASLQDVTEFFTTYYHPGNAVLTMVGDVDPDTAFALAKEYFGWIPAMPAIPPAKDGTIAPMTEPVRRELREQVPAEAYYSMFRAPADGTAEVEALEIALTVLCGTDSSRLTQRLVRDEQLAQYVMGGVNRLIGGTSAAIVSARARTGAGLDQIEAVILEETARLAEQGPTDEELEVAKARLERQFLDQTATCSGLADLISQSATLFGDPQHLNETVDRINAVTAAQVREAAATWLAPGNRAVLTYVLDNTARSAA